MSTTCPFCNMSMKTTQRFCPHCGNALSSGSIVDTTPSPPPAPPQTELLTQPVSQPTPLTDKMAISMPMTGTTPPGPPGPPRPSGFSPEAPPPPPAFDEPDPPHDEPPAGGRILSSGFFAAVILCIFLPFITISCGQEDITLTGTELLNLTEDTSELSPLLLVSAAVVVGAIIVGVLAGFSKRVKASVVGLIAGIAGAGGLLLLRQAINAEIFASDDSLEGMERAADEFLKANMEVSYEVGYWLAIGLFSAAAVLNLWLIARVRQKQQE